MSTSAIAEIKEALGGKWKVTERSEYFEDFLKEVGVNYFLRKVAPYARPTMTINVLEDGRINMLLQTGFFTMEETFKVDEEYEKDHIMMRMKSIYTWEDGRLVNKLTPVNPTKHKPQTICREREGDELLLTLCVGNVRCRRYLKRIS